LKGFHIHITGRVQGVGFRPFIYQLANNYHLDGWVGNFPDGVHVEIISSPEIKKICNEIIAKAPANAIIENLTLSEVNIGEVDGFSIVESLKTGKTDLQVTPDFAICKDCAEELKNPDNKRYNYPFITCTNCGPRYSIVQKVPYDRSFTSMNSFEMCESCTKEYEDVVNRRFYSQTNSCSECPIQLVLYDNNSIRLNFNQKEVLNKVSEAILFNKIIAIKGIGGYLLIADATSEKAISELRNRKKRPSKPFALMYPNNIMASKDVFLDSEVINEWEKRESPIVLCKLRADHSTGIIPELIAPGLNQIGIMMPYAPLFMLILDKVNKPIIATSGNISGSPIIYKDCDALDAFANIADYVLVNNRTIVVSQDDSVVQFSNDKKKRIILRRSRGLAPSFQNKSKVKADLEILAMGAMLKSAFGIIHSGRIYISQYLGNTETLESQNSYDECLNHMIKLLGFSPSKVLVDLHPNYPSSLKGKSIAQEYDAELYKIQHHVAHSFAVLGENDLINEKNILSIIWDGTGYGDDEHIWGGECFNYNGIKNIRAGHWDYFPHILGDKMIMEPRISAFCILSQLNESNELIKNKFDQFEWGNYKALLRNVKIKSSSVGRIFDAVASLLGISDIISFEGEAAMRLEALAENYLSENQNFIEFYKISISDKGIISTNELFSGIVGDIVTNKKADYIAAKFHISLVEIIRKMVDTFNYSKIAFSGGVFQNRLLVDLIMKILGEEYNLYFHKQLSPNDECIPYGQLVAYQQEEKFM